MKYFENETNAYMLIYVRQTEREQIMQDTGVQIPAQVENHFKLEELQRSLIEKD